MQTRTHGKKKLRRASVCFSSHVAMFAHLVLYSTMNPYQLAQLSVVLIFKKCPIQKTARTHKKEVISFEKQTSFLGVRVISCTSCFSEHLAQAYKTVHLLTVKDKTLA